MKKQILQLGLLILIALTAINVKTNAQSWKLIGNAGIDTAHNFLGTTDAKTLIFKTKNLERMRIQSGGKIGMGTKTPSAKLNIVSPDYVSLTTPGELMLGNVTSANMVFDNNIIQTRYNGGASTLYLNYYGGSVYSGNVNASTYGLVGAGVYEGVYGYSYGSSGIGMYGFSSTYHGIYGYTGGGSLGDPTGPAGIYGYNGSTGYGAAGYCVSGSGVYANSENYIGIFAVGNSSWYAGYFNGNVYTTGSYLPSDLKLKKNVEDLSSAMDIINKLHPKQYQYRQDGNFKLMNLPTGNRYGLIADDVEKVLPNLVKESKFNTRDVQPQEFINPKERSTNKPLVKNEEIDYKALNYTELIPIMIKGMQEQQAVIEKQQQQIDQLRQIIQNNNTSNSTDAKSATVSGAYLLQNAPNPFSQNTTVRCYVPSSVKQAQLAVYSNSGQLVKSYTLTNGMNNVTINAGTLSSGKYVYSLITDGKKVDTKSMAMAQ
jgi:hypothetical protein